MKILYGIQGTGNGHITRSAQIINLLEKYHQVDVLISGNQNTLSNILKIKYKFKGFNFSLKKSGKIDYYRTIQNVDFRQFYLDVKSIEFENYDLIISDFEPICAYGAKINKKKSIGISNQIFLKKQTKNIFKKIFLNYFSPTEINIPINFFEDKNEKVFGPILDNNLNKNSSQENFILIYMPHCSLKSLIKELNNFELPRNIEHFRIYHPEVKSYKFKKDNILLLPPNRTSFVTDLKKCFGVITNSGFSTISESLFLNKKIWSIPLENQFEQKFNAKSIEKKGFFVTKKLNPSNFKKWIHHNQPQNLQIENSAPRIVELINSILSKEIGQKLT